jgi:hypothetical protein
MNANETTGQVWPAGKLQAQAKAKLMWLFRAVARVERVVPNALRASWDKPLHLKS